MSDDHIEVICRVRPLNDRENGWKTCLNASKLSNTVTVQVKPAEKSFTFDFVADDRTSQEEIFQMVGLPVTQKCLQGYNGTILCYGQTGTGKSHTVFGASSSENALHPDRGLVPRVLEYLWGHISAVEAESNGAITFSCRCSFYEIYQERVYDLLDMNGASGGLQVRLVE
jgi:kinesin family protein 15